MRCNIVQDTVKGAGSGPDATETVAHELGPGMHQVTVLLRGWSLYDDRPGTFLRGVTLGAPTLDQTSGRVTFEVRVELGGGRGMEDVCWSVHYALLAFNAPEEPRGSRTLGGA